MIRARVDLTSAVVLLLALATTVAGALTLRAALAQERRVMARADQFAQEEQLRWKSLASEVEDLLERNKHERQRIDGRRGGRPPNQPDVPDNGGQAWTVESYRSFVERTGKTIPGVERQLGI